MEQPHLKSSMEKLLLEAFDCGAWWDVEELRIEGGALISSFENLGQEYDKEISTDHLRLRSRKANEIDCINFLKPNMDVCVFSIHPRSQKSYSELPRFSAWYDARIISIDRKPHQPSCACKFYVKFYRACMEDVLDVEHRQLFASKKKKLGLEKLSVLQAPYQLQVQPTLTGKIEFWGGDSSSLLMPALINESIKLQIAKLISSCVKQGIVAEINLRLSRDGDLHPCMHGDDTFFFSDQGDHGEFGLKFHRKEDGDCNPIEEQKGMITMHSNKHIKCIVFCIDKWYTSQLSLQRDDKGTSEQFSRKSNNGDGYHSSLMLDGLSKGPREIQDGIICLRRSERLKTQKQLVKVQKDKPVRKHFERKQGFTVKSKGLRQQQSKGKLAIKRPSHVSRKNHKDIASSGESCHLQAQGEEIEYVQQKQIIVNLGRSTSKRLRDPYIETLDSRKSKCLWEHDKQSENGNKSHIATQVEGNEPTEKQNIGKQFLTVMVEESDTTENKEIDTNSEMPSQELNTTDINTKSEVREVTPGMLDINESRSIISNTNSGISTKSDNSNSGFEISRNLKDREKHIGEIPRPTMFSSSRKDDNNLNLSPERTDIHCEPILTAKLESVNKGLVENIEIDEPSVCILGRCSMVENKIEIDDDLISDSRTNEDGLSYRGTIEEENSVLKNLCTEMKQTSHGDENDLNHSPEKTNIHCEPILTDKVENTEIDLEENNIKERLQHPYANVANEIDKPSVPFLARCSRVEKKVQVHEDLISVIRINDDGLDFNGILEEENSDLKDFWEQMEKISHGDKNNSNLSPQRTNIFCRPILTAKVDSTKKDLVENSTMERFQHGCTSTIIELDKSSVPSLGRCSMVEKKLEVHEDLIFDLRINEDSPNFHEVMEEENSDFRSFWKEMEQVAHGHENNLNLSSEKNKIDCKPFLVLEDLTSDLRINEYGLSLPDIIKEDNSDFKNLSKEMDQILHGDENNLNLSPERMDIACECIMVHEGLISDLRINEDGLNFHDIIEEENSDSKNPGKEMEQISHWDENNLNPSPEKTTVDCEPILLHEDLISDSRINEDGLNFHDIMKEENSYSKKLPNEMEKISHGDEDNFNLSPEMANTDYEPILTANGESTKKKLVDNNIKKTFRQVSASIASENVKPSISILARWSMLEKKIEADEDLISDLRINKDGLKVDSILEEENSDFKNLWKEMEPISPRDLLLSASMNPTNTSIPCNSIEVYAEDDEYGHFCVDGHEFVLDEEVGLICQLCNLVQTEINNVFEPFGVWNSGRSRSRSGYHFYRVKCSEDMDIPILDSIKGFPSCQSNDLSEKPKSVWKIIPELEKKMNAHQKRGFEFLWRNIAGSLVPEEMEASSRSDRVGGCIIAHAPGTGKSLMIISFLQSYLALFPACKPLIIAPKSMLHTWKREFDKWNVNIPVYILSSTREFTIKGSDFNGYVMPMSCKAPTTQAYNIYSIKMLHEWHQKESVLILSYNLFFAFTNEDNPKMSEESKQIGRYLTSSPGLLILDEGHIPRNHNSKIWNVLMRVKTRLRILLSGTLFQNNFEEYFNTLCLARPTFVDRILQLKKHQSEVSEEMVKEKIARRYFVEQILRRINTGRSMKRSACRRLLNSLTEDFIDVYKGDVLKDLPGLRTYTVMLKPTPLQETVFKSIHEILVGMKNPTHSYVELEIMTSIAAIHPCLLKDLSFIEKYRGLDNPNLQMDTYRKDPNQGIKLKFVVDIIRLCCEKGEKALVFCQYISPLLLLEEILEFHFHWCKGQEILLLEGKHTLHERQGIIDKFSQQQGKARVLLASIKACGIGINLTEASRVILLDLVWNPSCTKQAIGRAFRIGQKKIVHVYQLVAHGTLEEKKCKKAHWKEWLSSLIFIGENSGGDDNLGGQHVQQQALQIEDDMLKQLVERYHTSTFQRIFKYEDIHNKKSKTESDVAHILHLQ